MTFFFVAHFLYHQFVRGSARNLIIVKCFIFTFFLIFLIFTLWTHVISFKIMNVSIFNASLIIEWFVFLKNFVCRRFEFFKGWKVGRKKNVKMLLCVAMWIWMSSLTLQKAISFHICSKITWKSNFCRQVMKDIFHI